VENEKTKNGQENLKLIREEDMGKEQEKKHMEQRDIGRNKRLIVV